MNKTKLPQLLSHARTALTDPCGLPPEVGSPFEYAIEKLDQAMDLIDVELRPADALRTCMGILGEVADSLRGGEQGGDEPEHPAHDLDEACDLINYVIGVLPEETPPTSDATGASS